MCEHVNLFLIFYNLYLCSLLTIVVLFRFGAENILRKRLEAHISSQLVETSQTTDEACTVPVVCVVLGGGPDTVR